MSIAPDFKLISVEQYQSLESQCFVFISSLLKNIVPIKILITQMNVASAALISIIPILDFPRCGAREVRTPDPLRARQVLSQLSYGPVKLRQKLKLFVGAGQAAPSLRDHSTPSPRDPLRLDLELLSKFDLHKSPALRKRDLG
jgi:hypothetical protein